MMTMNLMNLTINNGKKWVLKTMNNNFGNEKMEKR